MLNADFVPQYFISVPVRAVTTPISNTAIDEKNRRKQFFNALALAGSIEEKLPKKQQIMIFTNVKLVPMALSTIDPRGICDFCIQRCFQNLGLGMSQH